MADTNGTTKKKTSRRPFWQEHLRAWSESGLTQADYCRLHQLSRAAFGWWKRQLQGKPKARKGSPATRTPQRGNQTAVRFVEVQRGPDVNTSTNTAAYEVLLSHRRAIRVGHEFDPDVLKRLIAAVEGSC
jgi:hypothetical protein